MNELLERLGHLDLRPKSGGRKADARDGLRSFLAAVFRADLEYYGVVRAWQEAALTDAGLGQMQKAIESWTQCAHPGGLPASAAISERAPGSRSARLRAHDGPALLVVTRARRAACRGGISTARSASPPM